MVLTAGSAESVATFFNDMKPGSTRDDVTRSDATRAGEATAITEIQPSLIPDPKPLGSEPLPPSPLATRAQLVGQILELNPTATPGFLSHFDEQSLRDYVEHLTVAQRPREERGGWVRRTNVPAIVMRIPAE